MILSLMKNNEAKNEEGKTMYHYGNYYYDITSAKKLECLEWYVNKYCVDNDIIINTELEWILKKYQFNNNNINDTKLGWILKKYQVNNDKSDDTVMSQMLYLSMCRAAAAAAAAAAILEMEIRSACQGVVNDNNCGKNIVHQKQNECKHNGCQVLLF